MPSSQGKHCDTRTTVELTFVRHAQPAWIDGDKSVLDPRLTDLGHQQVQKLAERLGAWDKPTQVFVSPAMRAGQTAAPVCQALGIEPIVIDWFNEIQLPAHWEGAPASTVSDSLHKARDRQTEEWWDGLPGGEPFRDFHDRVTDGLTELLGVWGIESVREHPRVWRIGEKDDRRFLFFGHGGANAVALAFLMGLDPVPWEWERFVTLHTGVSRVRSSRLLDGSIFGLRAHSDVSHLDRTLRSA